MRKVVILNGDCVTPISAYLRMSGKNKCLLESIPREEGTGRYSIIAYNPVLELTYHNQLFSVTNKQTADTKSYSCLDPLKEVEKFVLTSDPVIDQVDLPFQSGAIGYASYDIAACYEDIGQMPKDELNIPDLNFLVYESYLVIDHQKEQMTLVLENCYSKRSEAEINHAIQQLEKELRTFTVAETEKLDQETLTFKSNFTQQEYEEVVQKAKKLISEGDMFQVVPSQRLKAKFNQNPFDYYRRLRVTNPSAYLYYLDFSEDFKVIGSSPESLIRVKGEKIITNPIAGTRKRGIDKAEDDFLAEELLNDEKELAEHKMLIDLSRNDLGKVAQIGSVTVPLYMTIEKYRFVMHIVSVVEAKREVGVTAMDALKATLPAGTVSGAPKIRAMTRIYEWEPVKRGVYAGAVGYLSRDDQADFAIGIRTMVVKSGFGYVQAGAGVVYDSQPTTEYKETLQKAKALLEVSQHAINR